MTIEVAKKSCAKAIADIYAPYCAPDCYISFESSAPDVVEMEARIEALNSKFPFLVYKDGDKIIGYAYASPHNARAAYDWSSNVSIYLDQSFKGRGIGRKLYSCLFDTMSNLGYYNLYAGITLPNPSSEGIHKAMGFKQVAVYEKVGFKNGAWRDVLWLVLALRNHKDEQPEPVLPFADYLISDQKAFATTDGCLWQYIDKQT
ncbi:MAG: GNAT family N-acetyltransferase [Candidatus Melainabacteria bacterium]|nr:GNAT family N-acetyltransferase [Candidatus Melainabacteria bacterium]